MFLWDEGSSCLTSQGNSKSFHVGKFEVVSCGTLADRYRKASIEGDASSEYSKSGALVFQNIVASTRDLYADAENEGAVFQVCSLFNCLETCQGWGRPEDGVSMYADHAAQGPVSAICCPAATIYRNYFMDEVDCLSEAAEFLDNENERYWKVRNGYCVPHHKGAIATLSRRAASDPTFVMEFLRTLQVGVHWDTEVWTGTHRACQVFCSALPVALYKTTASASDWEVIARVLLEGQFDATLTVASLLAAERGTRVRVYLTPLGAGVLGNRRQWIVSALDRALTNHRKEPLDIYLVHFAEIPHDGFETLERKSVEQAPEEEALKPKRRKAKAVTVAAAELSDTLHEFADELPAAYHFADKGEVCHLTRMFAVYDANGDGYMDLIDFKDMLQHIDPTTFTVDVIDKLIETSDVGETGAVHYSEFLSWVFDEDAVTDTMMEAAKAAASLKTPVHKNKILF